MKNTTQDIIQLHERLAQERSFEKRYPEYNLRDWKTHVLYLSPCLNGTGYYRVIAPALELNRTKTHAAIISSLHKWDFTKNFEEYDNPVDERLIAWAHYVVLPTILTDISYILRSFLTRNPKLQFVMDMDCNFHALPKGHPQHAKISPQARGQFLANLARMDVISGASEDLLDYYNALLQKYHPESTVILEYIPNLLSIGSSAKTPSDKTQEKVRIGIPCNATSAKDILSIADVLTEIQTAYPDKIEWVFFGWDGKLPGGGEPLKSLQPAIIPAVSFLDYFDTLQGLNLDIALLPLRNIPFNTHGKSYIRYLELSACQVPVIASNLSPYNQVIGHKENGLLASTKDEWAAALHALLDDAQLRKLIARNAQRYVDTHFRLYEDTRWIYTDMFV